MSLTTNGGSSCVGRLLLAEGTSVAGLVRYQNSAVRVRPLANAASVWSRFHVDRA